jgi:uncharacterized membrane protein YdcZ (DUF606 family)
VALLTIFGGVALDNLGGNASMHQDAEDANVLVLLGLVAISGIGFAMQSKCNNALADDLGSAARATVVSACVNILFSIPIDIYLLCGRQIPVSIDGSYWYFWLVAGFQSAFYIGSMAYLPKVLGFTSCYVITLAAKLVTSLLVDAYGLTGDTVSISLPRVGAVVVVLMGSVMFNACGQSNEPVPDPSASAAGNEEDDNTNLIGSITVSSPVSHRQVSGISVGSAPGENRDEDQLELASSSGSHSFMEPSV